MSYANLTAAAIQVDYDIVHGALDGIGEIKEPQCAGDVGFQKFSPLSIF